MSLPIDKCALPSSEANRYSPQQFLSAIQKLTKEAVDLLTDNASGQVLAPNGTALTVKYAFANIAASQTDAALVAAVTGKKIRVLGYALHAGDTAGSDVTFNTKPVGAGAAITSLKALGINQSVVVPQSKDGWFETTAGQGLSVTTGAGSATGIDLVYVEV